MFLQGKDYEAPEASENEINPTKKNEIKALIRTYCTKSDRKYCGDIVKEIHKSENFTNDQIIEVIKEVAQEDDYTLPEPPPE